MPTLFMAYANIENNALPALQDEENEVVAVLSERESRNDYKVSHQQYRTRKSLTDQFDKYKNDICLFLYSGHAGKDSLLLDDGVALATGITALLQQCPNLKLVVLNGCSTAGQVQALLDAGIPSVIATSAPVGDDTAKQFAIRFFTELSKNRQSIRQSFQLAVDAAKVFGKIEAVVVSRDIMDIPVKNEPLWGLYYNDSKIDVLDNWRLPAQPIKTETNQYLKEAIALIFEERLKKKNIGGEAQETVLQRLPFTISEPIRKLIVMRGEREGTFYDKPSPERFRMLLYAYRSIINFVTFTLMSQLWFEKMQPKNTVYTEGVVEDIKNWLLTDSKKEELRSLLPLFRSLVSLFKDERIDFFFLELEKVLSEWEIPETLEAVTYLEKQIADNPQNHLDYLCDETEQHVAVVLYQFSFLVNYTLTSVKDIEVLFYMHHLKPTYNHKLVRLQQQHTNLEEGSEILEAPHKTAAILLRRMMDDAQLFLSPFLIDENAYTPRSQKANLRYFISFDTLHKQFYFKHVSKPEDILCIQKKYVSPFARIKAKETTENDYFSLIHEQFSAFCEAVLGKTLDNL